MLSQTEDIENIQLKINHYMVLMEELQKELYSCKVSDNPDAFMKRFELRKYIYNVQSKLTKLEFELEDLRYGY